MPTQTDRSAPEPRALDTVHYEVEGKLNPRYAETGDMSDYFGIYEVVKWQGDVRLEVIKTYRIDEYLDARFLAYNHAGRLQRQLQNAAASARDAARGDV